MQNAWYNLVLPLSAFFIRPFYKMMLGKPITIKDMEAVVSACPQSCLRHFLRITSFVCD